MLAKIEISNFKNFKNNFLFDLSNTSSFNFNQECIRNKIVNKAIVYGQNGCGKSNLGFAIFDLISHLTDKETEPKYYKNYLNADLKDKKASFKFEFKFDKDIVEYSYSKSDYQTLVSEELKINDNMFLSINREESSIFSTIAKGAENLKTDIGDSNISIVNYILKNSVLDENKENELFIKFKEFVDKMLYFRSLDDRCYIGLEQGSSSIADDVVKRGNLKDFESFLSNAGINCKLVSKKNFDDKNTIYFKFKNESIKLFDIASSGTVALTLFYYWYQRLKDKDGNSEVSFLFIDEFDAFYHHSLSRIIIEKLKEITSTQVILTTHNTSILSNDLLRPDCYFLMYPEKINSLVKSTEKELREAHNIEKMYRAGSFE
ncbi:AAA family ATPase [Aliarcobacter butzleri]|uniref:AAA family ATPase n=1 Tax=Aliarcobacter butzleri TaxID=28197 RepID=UPI001ED9DBD4|nr:ATP-binding protein [Aliarcobacter butzleri]MCG3671553.1 ATP-binding protein [Aliarcobacter butzleri]MCG3690527.1 ATP-binding protein [Aliarcobacter butzleri]